MPKRPKYIGALALTVVLTVSFIGPQLYERYASTFVPSADLDGSAQSRIDLWRDCLQVIGQYPIFGVGPANWRVISSTFGWAEGKSAHSVWMETAAEVGAPGSLLLFLFFAIAAIRLWPIARARVTDANRYQVILASGVILAIVGFAVSGQFVSVPGLEVPYYIVMLGAAMLKHGIPQPAATESAKAPTRVAPTWPLTPRPRVPIQQAPALNAGVLRPRQDR